MHNERVKINSHNATLRIQYFLIIWQKYRPDKDIFIYFENRGTLMMSGSKCILYVPGGEEWLIIYVKRHNLLSNIRVLLFL